MKQFASELCCSVNTFFVTIPRMTITESPSIPEGLTYKDKDQLIAKLSRFAGQTARIHAVADFDRTLTQRRGGVDEDITSWNILRDHLPPDEQAECKRLFEIAWPKEVAGTMTEQDAVEWWSSVLDIYARNHLDMNEVERDFMARASIRVGAKELFDLFKTLGIPSTILSAGVKDVIDLWSAVYEASPTLTISTELVLDENRRMMGWKRETLVHVLNKSEVDHPELNRIRAERPLSIIFGDSINDADMAIGDEDVLRVRIYDPRPGEATNIGTERAKTFERFDLMIGTGSLEPLTQLLQLFAKS